MIQRLYLYTLLHQNINRNTNFIKGGDGNISKNLTNQLKAVRAKLKAGNIGQDRKRQKHNKLTDKLKNNYTYEAL